MNRGVLTTLILHSLYHYPTQIHVKTTTTLSPYYKIRKRTTLSGHTIERISNSYEPYVRQSAKIGRNSPCLCGSGLKYKKCCYKK